MKTTRRHLIGSVAATAAAAFVPRHVLGGPRFVPPSEKVNVALVGAGGQGRENTRALLQEPDVQVIAVADPAERWNLDAFYKGKLLTEGWAGQQRLLPYEKTAAYRKPPKTLLRSKGHHRDWIDACKGGSPASANFQYGAKLTELVLLGGLALRLGKPIAWDAENLKVPGAPEADLLINEPRRKGWEIA